MPSSPRSSSPTTGTSTRPPPASQSMSNAPAYGDSWPWVSTCHHQAFSHGRAMPTWLGTMSTSTPIPSRRASLDSAASPAPRPREASIAEWSDTS